MLGGRVRGETDESEEGDVKDALGCRLHHGETCVDNSEGDFKSGPQSIFDNGYGEVPLGIGRGELNHVVRSPCRSETDTKPFIRSPGETAPQRLQHLQTTQAKDKANGNLLARAHLQSPKHRQWENQDTDIEDKVEDGAEKEFECKIAAVLRYVRTKLPIEPERTASGKPGDCASNQVGHGCRLKEVHGKAELPHRGEDLQDKVENGEADE